MSREKITKQQREDRAVEALIAMVLRQDTLTDAEIGQFMKEWDEGKHQLSPEDEAALERARPEFLKALRREIKENPL